MPSACSASSADSKVIWLDITDPARISSAVRSETRVTSWPGRSSPSASAVPAGPGADDRDPARGGSCRQRLTRGRVEDTGHAGDRGSITAMWSTPASSRRSTSGPGREPAAAPDRDVVVAVAVHARPPRTGAVLSRLAGSAASYTSGTSCGPAAEQVLGRAGAHPVARPRAEVADRGERDHPVDRVGLVGQPQHEVPAGRVADERRRGGLHAEPGEQRRAARRRRRRRRPTVRRPAAGAPTAVLRRRDDVPLGASASASGRACRRSHSCRQKPPCT